MSADRSPRRVRPVVVVTMVVVVAVVVIGVIVALFLREAGRPVPPFPSLLTTPDPSIRGTVAYVDDGGCIRMVAAGGGPSKQVYCLPALDPAEAESLGKPIGPQLVWLDGGRLEVTMFRMTEPPSAGFRPGWQKIVDVRTGAVTDVPDVDAPAAPEPTRGRPTIGPDGAEVSFTSDAGSGAVAVQVTAADGSTRTLLEAQGPGAYTYGIGSAFWAADFSWVAVDDGRILVVTTDDPAVTRVLVDPGDSGFGPADPRFAVTAEELIAGGAG